MMFCDFETTTYGKWILAGEHAVLRGHGALVFPIKEKRLTLHYTELPSSLGADFSGLHGADMHLLFWSVLEHGMHLLGGSIKQVQGHFHLENNIPVGVGMGASAALCVAVARWFSAQERIASERMFEFARELEHLFHGKSSGLDVAGVASEQGIYFKQGIFEPIKQRLNPQWTLSSCQQIGITAHCIQQVQQLWNQYPQAAQAIDHQMAQAVQDSKAALEEAGSHALSNLIDAMNQARSCFSQWGLVNHNLEKHMNELISLGALAVKPTGSGGGGYVLSLWGDKKPINLDLIHLV